IRAFNRVDHEKERFSKSNGDLMDVSIAANVIMAGMMPFTMFLMNLATVAIIWFGGIRVNNGGMKIGELMAFIQYATQILMSINGMSFILVMLPRASASATRINEVLETSPGIMDTASPKPASEKRGYVEFRDVTFSYPGAEQPAISNISFKAEPGEITAIIGGTGSGKSTMINLLPRFYDIDSGSVMVDGVDVREITQDELRSKLGYVPQKAILFTGTVEENIKYGKLDASMDEIRHAAETAQALDFIEGMKDGFSSHIAQGGTNVSGGQKQRLSIARAFVRKPEIYIFDDSFSALDFKTDARLRAAMKKETAESTVIIVAQRVSTIMDADRIIVLDDGRIAGMGNHRELLSSCEVYREIVSSQLSEEEIA
ncbi:MAG: ABC transporter ATP-binding protein, partial [Clostridiales bacterium]|nr:ABC transporter ATP-binding protein [Clostridiales bacterium]